MPPKGRAEAPRAGGEGEPDTRDDDATPLNPRLRRPLLFVLVLLTAFVGLYITHGTLLGLPYYWDEAGYFIPHSTLSNAHPPLVMAWIALAWKLFGFHIEVARTAMLAVAAVALAGVFALGCRVANWRVAAATVLLTAAYPVFFAQSSLAHLDMMVAALTTWALVFYLPPRDAASLQGHATSLQADAMALRDDATPLQNDATPLRDAATPLRHPAMALRDGAESLRGTEKA